MRVTQFLDRNVACQPNGVALIDDEGALDWTGLRDRVARLAAAFKRMGLQPGGRVAMLANNSRRYVEFYLASVWAGGAAVPINHRLAPAEMRHVLADSGTQILIVDDAFVDLAEPLLADVEPLRRLITCGERRLAQAQDYETLLREQAPIADATGDRDEVIGIFYTGGTTGLPKGVMLTHENMWASCWSFAIHVEIGPASVSLCSGPLFHVSAMAALMPFLMVGGRVVILPRFSTRGVIAAIETHRITVMNYVPTMVRMLLDDPSFHTADLSSVKKVMFGGAPLSDALVEELRRAMPDTGLMPAYGMTELTACVTILPPELSHPDKHHLGRFKSGGQAVIGCDVAILGPDGRELPRRERGEICARGPVVMKGYWNRPDLTAETIRDGWLHTGDIGWMDEDGFVYIVDRLKDMIISGGENVYSAEVENVIAALPGVSQCAVIGLPDERWGELVHAIVVPSAGHELAPAAIVEHCRTRIAGYKVPRSVEIRTQPMPLSAANKILKSELRKEWLARQERAPA